MQQHTENELRRSFVNCTRGAAERIGIPKDLLASDWSQRVFLGWTDPKAPQNGYVVAETEDGLKGLVLHKNPKRGRNHAQMCQICLTLHSGSGIAMVSIPRTTSVKERYRSMGTYICEDLGCSDYTRGIRRPEGIRQMEETMTAEDRAERTLGNLRKLIRRVEDRA